MEELMGVIKSFSGNFAPVNFMFCDGRLLSIAQNSALFSLLGTTYGGDGITTFALPNLNGRYPLGVGSNGNQTYVLGEQSGTPQTTIMSMNLPSITSQLKVAKANATSASPSATSSIAIPGTTVGRDFTAVPSFIDNATPASVTILNPQSVMFMGQNLPIDNMIPYMGMNYIICVQGIYPSRP
ncbi:phage tail protein [Chryseobacterium limigenitum]|uniref:Microcystin-dependent protein n=1 Tax=Chryseobacterium limigenitum TaxID=1612149 RepID=A0A1K2IGV2_9FLAO|nr:tail fiber protein [Chryseobacterium limigenitum]SFZ91490.1 Microcystin-dependent protein [Chryseobacterium limigenitum]